MPTDRPRHSVTESDDLEQALDDAAERWPEDRGARARLLVRLAREGHRAIQAERDAEVEARRTAIRATSGALTGVYPQDYLADLRGDWPA
ncbi:MAG TPA: hypothetical protein VFD31_02750 [Thermoleophilaceae bacterium]|nr:hypothetical protein [Thermoleophilaceae bacterium]